MKKESEKVQKQQTKSDSTSVQRVTELVSMLNHYRHEYYNLTKPSVSDAVYDRLFDEAGSVGAKNGNRSQQLPPRRR